MLKKLKGDVVVYIWNKNVAFFKDEKDDILKTKKDEHLKTKKDEILMIKKMKKIKI